MTPAIVHKFNDYLMKRAFTISLRIRLGFNDQDHRYKFILMPNTNSESLCISITHSIFLFFLMFTKLDVVTGGSNIRCQ